MPEVQSDIKVLVTPTVGATDLSTLRQQVEGAFKTPINVKINMGDIAASARKQAERAAKATRREFSKVQVTPGKTFFKEFSDQFTKQTPEIKRLGTYYGQLQKQAEQAAKARRREFSKVQVIPGKTFFEEFSDQFTKQTPEIKRLGEYYGQLQKQAEQAAEATRREFSKVQVIPGKTFFEEFSDQFTKQTPEIKRLGEYYGQLQKQAEQAAKAAESANKAAESANKAALRRGQTALAGWDTKAEGQNVQRLKQYNDELQRAYDNAKALVDQGQPDAADTKGWETLADAIEKYRVELSKALYIQSSNNAKAQNEKNFADIQRQAETYFQKYETNITRNLSLSTKWQNLLNNLRNPDIDNTSVVEYRKQLADLMNESRDAGVELESTGQKLSRLFGQHLSTAVAMAAIHALRRVLQQTYQTVIELDKALVNLQVSSGKSRSELKSLMMQYSEFAKSLGTTTIAVTQAADTWLRQGYDLSEIETLITDSIHLSVLGKIDSEEATKALTSTMKGYGIAVQDASTIVDKFTTVDMNAATSAGDLATAMAECAVSAQLMGVDIDHLTGYLATVMETTQDGAESVGVFMKTMFARMANIKTGKLVDPEDQSDISDVERVLKNQNILLRDAQGNFRNFQEVLEETAQKWRELGEAGKTADQSALAVAFGGVRNQEKFKVFMENYDTAIKYANIATDSTGNAAKKYEAYMDGIEARMNRLTATFEEFAQTILNSDAIKGVIDFLTNILNLLQQITAWSDNAGFGALTPLFGLGGGILGASGKGVVAAKTGILLNDEKGVIRTFFSKKDIKQLTQYNQYVEQVKKGVDGAQEKLAEFGSSMTNTAQAAAKAANGGTVALKNFGDMSDWAALKAQALNAAIGMGIGLLISLAVSTLTTLIDNYTRRAEIAHEATAETIAEYEKQESSIASLNDSLDENYGKLRELHALKGTDKWNDTLEEQYKTLQRQTLELEQQLALEEAKDALTQKDVADKLKDEAETTEGVLYYNPVDGNEAPHQASWWESFGVSGPITSSTTGLTVAWVQSQSETVQDVISKLEEYNAILEQGNELTVEQVEHYRSLAEFLSPIITQYQEWIKQGEGNPWLTTEIDQWKELVRIIQGVLNPDIYNFKGLEDTTGYVRRSIESALKSGELSQAVYAAQIQGADKTDFLNQTSKDSAAYAWVTEQAHAAQMSVEAYVDELVKLGIMTDNVVPKQDDLASSLLDIAKVANNDLEDAAKAYEALESAVSDYNDAGYITDDTLQAINDRLPGVLELLMDENGQLTDNAAAAMGSTDSLIKFIRAQLQAQLEAARTNYQNLVNELNRVKAAADGSAASMAAVIAAQANLALAGKGVQDAQDALDHFNKYAESGAFTSKGRSGGGGGSKSIYSQQYEEITNLTEHYIKMSELRQKRMSEESDEYKAESKQQFLYYQQLAQQTYAEISRLRAKGYTESNADFRKLLQNYEGYLNSMYDIAKAMWEQEKQERIKAIQEQIDDENDRWESRKKQLDHEKDYYEALLDLEERYLDTIGDVHKEIRSLDRELAAAKAYPEGTNLSLFTDDEHDHLVAQLRDVEAEATDLYTKYQEKLASVSAENTYELSHITDEFQRQYEILLKQYEISKADLAVARARRELENVLNERNVAMLVNGVWTWVADPESVKAAVEAVYDAEQDTEDKLTDLFNTQRTQLLEETISNIELQTNIEQAAHDKIIEGLEKMIEEIEDMEFVFEDFIQQLLDGADGIAAALASAIAAINAAASGPGSSGPGAGGSYTPKTGVPVIAKKRYTVMLKPNGEVRVAPDPILEDIKKMAHDKNREKVLGRYAAGGVADYTGHAHLDGSKSSPEVIFNSNDAAKLYHLVHTTPNLVDKLIGNVQAKFEAILPAGFKGSGNPSMTTDNSRKVYWNGNVLMEGHDADNFLTMLERVLPVV